MSSVVLSGDTSGAITLSAPAVAGSTVLNLPATTGTVAFDGPAFSATGTSQSAPTSATWTKMVFATEQFDTASNYDATTSRFQPSVAGYYDVKYNFQLSGPLGGNYIDTKFYKTGSPFISGGSANSVAYPSLLCSALIYLNGSTDYVEIYQYQSSSAASTNNFFFQAALARAA